MTDRYKDHFRHWDRFMEYLYSTKDNPYVSLSEYPESYLQAFYAQWCAWIDGFQSLESNLFDAVPDHHMFCIDSDSMFFPTLQNFPYKNILSYFHTRAQDMIPRLGAWSKKLYGYPVQVESEEYMDTNDYDDDIGYVSISEPVPIATIYRAETVVPLWISEYLYRQHNALFLEHQLYEVIRHHALAADVDATVQTMAMLLASNRFAMSADSDIVANWYTTWNTKSIADYPVQLREPRFWRVLIQGILEDAISTDEKINREAIFSSRIGNLPLGLQAFMRPILSLYDWDAPGFAVVSHVDEMANMFAQTFSTQQSIGKNMSDSALLLENVL